MRTILFVFGTRPEAIKMAPLVKSFQNFQNEFRSIVCVTAQHRQMLDQILQLFQITPDYDLDIMKPDQDLFDITIEVIKGLREILECVTPDFIFVHGDTSTSTAAALAAFFKMIPVCHVEAGLRTNEIYNPWPEEMNRQITSRLTTYHFAPTRKASENLLLENINPASIIVTGNTVIDALEYIISRIRNNHVIEENVVSDLVSMGLPKRSMQKWSGSRKMILVTAHRRESFGAGFQNICSAIRLAAERYPMIDFVYPVHPNPNVRSTVHDILKNDHKLENVFITNPIGYLGFVYLLNKSHFILTDSGGIQEEAPALGKPVLVLRNKTERPEALEIGAVELVGTDIERITTGIASLLDDPVKYSTMSSKPNPYGDGEACMKIVDFIRSLT